MIGLLGHVADFLVGVRLAVVLLLQESVLELLYGLRVSASQRHQLAFQLLYTTHLLLAQHLHQNALQSSASPAIHGARALPRLSWFTAN